MKRRITSLAGCYWLLVGSAAAQLFTERSIPITIEAHVRDLDGKPVEGATVHLSLPRYGLGRQNQWADRSTNADGIAIVSGNAHQDYGVSVKKAGYYYTAGPHRSINTDTGFKLFAVGVQKIDLELRPIRHPAPIIAKSVWKIFPALDRPLGFDLEVGDWVAPDGAGRVRDFIFTVGGYFNGLMDFDQTLTLTFSRPGDGIVLTRVPTRIGSKLKFPYEAPLIGYESKREWRDMYDGKARATNIDISGETNYIFRVRTELDEKGNVRRALHGVIATEIVIGGNNEIGRRVSFKYALNPDWTRNIEFDPDALAKTGP